MSALVMLAGITGCGALAARPLQGAEPPRKLARVGFLSQAVFERANDLPAFRQGLQDAGYVEGDNVALELRFAEGDASRLPELAADLVRQRVDVIVATSSPAISAAQQATSSIPVVMGISADPVAQGFVQSLNRPGGNVTGLTSISLELSAKRLEVLREVVPAVSRVAVFWDPSYLGKLDEWRATQEAAQRLGVELGSVEVRRPEELPAAFEQAAAERADAGIVLGGPMFQQNHAQLVQLAQQARLPVMYETPALARAGGLMAYGPVTTDLFYRAAYFVDRILKGTPPAELPVERPTRFYLTINLAAARAIDLTIPANLRWVADEFVE